MEIKWKSFTYRDSSEIFRTNSELFGGLMYRDMIIMIKVSYDYYRQL